jgi:hypothetical protein
MKGIRCSRHISQGSAGPANDARYTEVSTTLCMQHQVIWCNSLVIQVRSLCRAQDMQTLCRQVQFGL